MCQLFPVTFHGDTIFCLDYQNQPYTPMRPIVENMGLDWSAQAAKLRANKERWTVVIITTVAQNGSEREMLCMPVRKLPSYLNSINPRKVAPELRAKIELYQAESDDALWDYWMHGRAERPAPQTAEAAITPDQQCTLQAIVRARVEGTKPVSGKSSWPCCGNWTPAAATCSAMPCPTWAAMLIPCSARSACWTACSSAARKPSNASARHWMMPACTCA